VDLAEIRKDSGSKKIALQGKCRSGSLVWPSREKFAKVTLGAINSLSGHGHILNLGHGILQHTPVEKCSAIYRDGATKRCFTTQDLLCWCGRKTPRMTLAHPSLQQNEAGELHVGEGISRQVQSSRAALYQPIPPRPVWNDAFGPADLERVHEGGRSVPGRPVSLYMHIPFCESLCLFCACNVRYPKEQKRLHHLYLDVLKRGDGNASAAASRRVAPVVQFHWGGGNTDVPDTRNRIEDLFAFTKERFPFRPRQ